MTSETHHVFRPEIVVLAKSALRARGVLLKLLAELELEGKIERFQLGEAEA